MEKDRGGNSGEQIDWKRAIQALISAGHKIEDIKNYTLNQVVTFYEAIIEERMDNIKRDVVVQATAMSGDNKQIKKFIDNLDGKPPEMMKIVREE